MSCFFVLKQIAIMFVFIQNIIFNFLLGILILHFTFSAGTDKGDNDVDGKAAKPGDVAQQKDLAEVNPPASDPSSSQVASSSCMEVDSADAPAAASSSQAACSTKSCISESSFRPRSPEHSPNIEDVEFKVIFSKSKYDITFPLDDTVAQLKDHLEIITGGCYSVVRFRYIP